MQMHISNKVELKKGIIVDHTLIIEEIDRSIKFYNWEFILPFLPSGSFLVGGYIRDIILCRLNKKIDIDIVVPKNSKEIGEKIAKDCQGKFILLDKEREVVRIIFQDIEIDIASRVSNSIKHDLSSRDFSINSIAFSFDEKLIIDPQNGIKDIERSLLRTNSKKNLIDDPLRILRCFRFISELDFDIDLVMIDFIKKYKNKLNSVAKERIQYELQRIIRGKNALKSIKLIKELEILSFLQPEKDLIIFNSDKIKFKNYTQSELERFLPLFYLVQILDEISLKKLNFNKSEIQNVKFLRKWLITLKQKNMNDFTEIERFDLHQQLETILPSFIFFLPYKFQLNWLTRWRDKGDKLYHPTNLIKGDVIKNSLEVQDGPLLGKLIRYLSIELAYKRLENFDEAIYKAKKWIKQNAPKCD